MRSIFGPFEMDRKEITLSKQETSTTLATNFMISIPIVLGPENWLIRTYRASLQAFFMEKRNISAAGPALCTEE